MRIQICSDLHLDVKPVKSVALAEDVDLVVVAGDVYEGIDKAFVALRQIVPASLPVVMVAGNHEFYRRSLPDELALARRLAPDYGITFLENDSTVIGEVRFVGATLWTDYAYFNGHLTGQAMNAARKGLNDHRLITWCKQPWRRFRPEEALLTHHRSRQFLERVLATRFDGPTVVVTHHAPHPLSVHPRYAHDLLTAAFVSDLTGLIAASQPDLWVHGHVHDSFDYRVGATRIVCNPIGYGRENPAFDPSLVLEVGR